MFDCNAVIPLRVKWPQEPPSNIGLHSTIDDCCVLLVLVEPREECKRETERYSLVFVNNGGFPFPYINSLFPHICKMYSFCSSFIVIKLSPGFLVHFNNISNTPFSRVLLAIVEPRVAIEQFHLPLLFGMLILT